MNLVPSFSSEAGGLDRRLPHLFLLGRGTGQDEQIT